MAFGFDSIIIISYRYVLIWGVAGPYVPYLFLGSGDIFIVFLAFNHIGLWGDKLFFFL